MHRQVLMARNENGGQRKSDGRQYIRRLSSGFLASCNADKTQKAGAEEPDGRRDRHDSLAEVGTRERVIRDYVWYLRSICTPRCIKWRINWRHMVSELSTLLVILNRSISLFYSTKVVAAIAIPDVHVLQSFCDNRTLAVIC